MAKILVVDDLDANRDFLVTLLGYGGHRLLEARDGAEALRLARAELPDLVITDILMPTMDGYELVHELRADPATCSLPVIFYTAHYHEHEAQTLARQCGVSHILTKPAEPEVVLRTVQEVLGVGAGTLKPQAFTPEFDREHLRLLTDKLAEKADQLTRSNERLTALVELGVQLGSERDPQRLLQILCDSARGIVVARRAMVTVVDPETRTLRYVVTSGMDADTAAQCTSLSAVECLLGEVIEQRQCVRRHHPHVQPGTGFPPFQSVLLAPLTSPSKSYGWLCLIDKPDPEGFSDEDERLGEFIAAKAGRVYENGTLYVELLERATQLDAEVRERRQVEVERDRFFTHSMSLLGVAEFDTTIKRVNPAWEKVLGYSNDELIGKVFVDMIHPDDRAAALAEAQRMVNTGEDTVSFETRCRCKDGSYRSLLWNVTPFLDRQELHAAGHDITRRKRTERELAEGARLALLTGDVGTALTRGDTLGEILNQCTEALVRHLDVAFARIWTLNAGENVLELAASSGIYTHLDGAHSRIPVGEFKIGKIAQERLPHLTNDVLTDPCVGDKAWARREGMVAFAGYPLLVEDRLVGVIGMFARHQLTDTTLNAIGSVADQIAVGVERKWAAAERDKLLQHLQLQIDRMPLAYLLLDPDCHIVDWNPSAETIFGFRKEEVVGLGWPFEKILPSTNRTNAEGVLSRLKAGDMSANAVNDNLTKDGKTITCEWFNTPILAEDGRFQGAICLAQNVTERRRLEDQLRQAQKMEAVGQLAGGIAHDFNNLLTVINGYAEILLEKTPEEDEDHELIEEIHRSGQRAATLTRQLLAFSRRQMLVPIVFDVNKLIHDMEKLLQRLIGEDVELRVSSQPDPWLVESDPGQIEQVIMNLVVNARDAMPRGGKLTIETRNVQLDEQYAKLHADAVPGDFVMLAVTDTGHGMDQGVQARIFEPFFTTKEQGKGTGLGLSTVYGIVRQSGGHIAVYSEVGVGTLFKIFLPRTACDAEAPSQPTSERADTTGTETILIVEDEAGVRGLARSILEARGYHVLVAADGREALQISQQFDKPIQLLLSDVVMPHISGPQLADRLACIRPEIRVLFVSGYTDEAILNHGILDADQPFLHKPFKPAALAQKVREVLDSPPKR